MPITKILAVSFEEASALALSLKEVLEQAPSFEFNLRTLDQSLEGAKDKVEAAITNAIASVAPDLLLLCLAKRVHPLLKPIVDAARQNARFLPTVMVSAATDPEDLRPLLALVPDEFITPPFRAVDVLPRLWRLHPGSAGGEPDLRELKEKLGLKQLIGESAALLGEIKKIPSVARCDATVLITGETGTGKEMFARAIHFLGPRSARPFSPLNCGAIPVDLLENELFGHETGAYTDARTSSVGLLRQTDGGSLFLDEVDTLPLLAQVKLLRFLQEKEFRPLGSHKSCRADVRVIAASNGNLEEAVQEGRFRRDLYYRLNVVRMLLPPLRDRKEDIPVLAEHFLSKYAAAFAAPARRLTPAAVQKLMLYDWPGNVRELENIIERSVVFCPQAFLRPEDIPLPNRVADGGESFQSLKLKVIAQFERGYIRDLLRANNGNISKAARAARKNRRAFWEIMRKHQIGV